jgi:hypothetical protein
MQNEILFLSAVFVNITNAEMKFNFKLRNKALYIREITKFTIDFHKD